ncbi:GNAT family N-acetyltransferase [Bdellovibrio sp. GT3]|uniref:GNAT family N-acetyltransferase n=1 Tax=Bdellovibrio sp. GT3 TaxID=3136282 RepID=UPI0030F10554
MRISSEVVSTKKQKQVLLRSPNSEDALGMIQAMVEIAATSPHIIGSVEDFKKKTVEEEQAWIQKHNDDLRGLVIIAEYENKTIGILNFNGGKSAKTKHRGSLGISLHSDMRGEGLGYLIFQKLLSEVRKIEGLTQMELSLFSENHSAYQLYKKVGFQECGRRPRAYRQPDGTFCDEIIMIKTL